MSEGHGGGTLLDEFFVLLGVKSDVHGLDKFSEKLSGVHRAMEALGLFAAYELSKHLMEYVEHAIEGASQTQDLSEAIGMAATEIDAFTVAGMRMGVETSDMVSALDGITRAAGAAAAGFPRYTKLFEQLFGKDGVNEAKKSTQEIFDDIAKKFVDMDPRTRLAVAGRLGISGKLAKVMSEGNGEELREYIEQARKSAILTDEDYEKADKAKIQFERLGKVISQVTTVIGIELVPVVKRAMDLFLDWWGENRQRYVQKFGDLLWVVIYYVNVLWTWIKKVASALDDAREYLFGNVSWWHMLLVAIIAIQSVKLAIWIMGVAQSLRAVGLSLGWITLIVIGIMGLISIATQVKDNWGVILNWFRDAWRGIIDQIYGVAEAILKIPGVKRVIDWVAGDSKAKGATDRFLSEREAKRAQEIRDTSAPDWTDMDGVAHWRIGTKNNGGQIHQNKTTVKIDKVEIKADKGREQTVGKQLDEQIQSGVGSARNAQGPFKS